MRPTWDEYFMAMAYLTAMRSIDDSTKCGCVIVSTDNKVLSVGYNGSFRGINDSEVPQTRPEKYDWFEHAERNAIFNARKNLEGSTAYITGPPCMDCFRALIQCGIAKIYFGNIKAKMNNDETLKLQHKMASIVGITLSEMNVDFMKVFHMLQEYLSNKKIIDG